MLITFFLHQYRLTTAVCTWRCAQGCHCSFGVSQPTTYYSEAQKNFNFQDSWNSLIRDFCICSTLCVEITWPKKKLFRHFVNQILLGAIHFWQLPNFSVARIFFTFSHSVDRVSRKTLPKSIVLTPFTTHFFLPLGFRPRIQRENQSN